MLIEVVIVTYKPDKELIQILDKLNTQTLMPDKIHIINTEEIHLEKLLYGTNVLNKYKNIFITNISKFEFDHARTRDRAIRGSKAEYVLCMTQDAIPMDDELIEKLLKAFSNPQKSSTNIEEQTQTHKVAVSYARQLPKEDCNQVERFTRKYNYPSESMLKGKEDIERLGIKTYFCSDVCAMYHKETYIDLGGFVSRAIFNEDMIFAHKAVQNNYYIYYNAEAEVFHSHNYKFMKQLKRNFDLGVSQADHPEIFNAVSSESEGIRLIKTAMGEFISIKKPYLIIGLLHQAVAKVIGYKLGKSYKKLKPKTISRLTSNPNYWIRFKNKKAIENIDVHNGYGKSELEK